MKRNTAENLFVVSIIIIPIAIGILIPTYLHKDNPVNRMRALAVMQMMKPATTPVEMVSMNVTINARLSAKDAENAQVMVSQVSPEGEPTKIFLNGWCQKGSCSIDIAMWEHRLAGVKVYKTSRDGSQETVPVKSLNFCGKTVDAGPFLPTSEGCAIMFPMPA
ncbi:hypothetical protein ACFL2D_02325 [Patescibacteria group bacterium]